MLAEVVDPTNYLVSVHSVGPWVAGLLTAALGIAVLLRERGSKVSQALGLLTTSLTVWLLCIGMLYRLATLRSGSGGSRSNTSGSWSFRPRSSSST